MEESCKSGYSGGEELRRAMAALAGPSGHSNPAEEESNSPQPAPLPLQLASVEDVSVRELAFAAQRYDRLAQREPDDFEAVYNHGLALQELALRATASRHEQLQLLQQAAERYATAWKLKPDSHAALYNWGVALSDMARVTKAADPREATGYLQQAAEKYSKSLKYNPNQPQALNNWGLVLQELASMGAPAEQAGLVRDSIRKFRGAIRMRPDFDRACYNLGTVFYALACTQQASLTQQLPSRVTQGRGQAEAEAKQQATARATFAESAQYIVLAHAMQPGKEVYRNSLRLVQPLLPLPCLRTGFLLAKAVPSSRHSCSERWERVWFVLDEAGFRSAASPTGAAEDAASPETAARPDLRVELADIASATPCLDPSLPAGAAFWLRLGSQSAGLHFVAESAETAEGWVDALLLGARVAATAQLPTLRRVLRQPPGFSGASSPVGDALPVMLDAAAACIACPMKWVKRQETNDYGPGKSCSGGHARL